MLTDSGKYLGMLGYPLEGTCYHLSFLAGMSTEIEQTCLSIAFPKPSARCDGHTCNPSTRQGYILCIEYTLCMCVYVCVCTRTCTCTHIHTLVSIIQCCIV